MQAAIRPYAGRPDDLIAAPPFRDDLDDAADAGAIGAVRARSGSVTDDDARRAAAFAEWLVANHAKVDQFAREHADPHLSPELFARIYPAFGPKDLTSEEFVAATASIPIVQVVGDLTDYAGTRTADRDTDMRDYISNALSPTAGQIVLDAGCSTGRNFLPYADGVSCIGFDLDLVGLMIGARAWAHQPRARKPVLCCDTILDMPIADRSIDGVQSFVVLGLVPIRQALTEIRRVLKPGGRLAFTVEGPGFWQELWDRRDATGRDKIGLTRWLVGRKLQERGVYWQGHKRFGRLAGLVQYTPESISRILVEQGFEVLDASPLRTYRGLARVVGVTARPTPV